MNTEVAVVGAGIAGLACARGLAQAGLRPLVIDKARGPGGRCATRRVDNQPIDFGVLFAHGSNPQFVRELGAVGDATPLLGWPNRIHGSGTPCQPAAFHAGEQRLAWAEGMTRLPRHLATGLDLRLRSRVVSLTTSDYEFRLQTDSGDTIEAPRVMIALPAEQTRELLGELAPNSREVTAARSLLSMLASMPALTVLAGYELGDHAPDWDLFYPADSEVLHLLAHESAKRAKPRFLAMVYQARPRWSGLQLEQPTEQWANAMLAEAGRLLGAWASRPSWHQTHRWRYARVDRGNELSTPMLLSLHGGLRLGLAGDVFSPGGGLQASYLSGRTLARRLLSKELRP